MPTKMALVVRTDLGLGKGKIAAQAAHAAVAAVLVTTDTSMTTAWLAEGQPKVVRRPQTSLRDRNRCTEESWPEARYM